MDIERINYLAKKAKTEGLTEEEKQEQAKLRREYIDSVVGNLKAQLDNTYTLDKNGNEVKITAPGQGPSSDNALSTCSAHRYSTAHPLL